MNTKSDFNHCESIYWVFTQLCNDKCDHCYNLSGPDGARISEEECLQVIENLPDSVDRIILSGGEPLADKKKLYLILDNLSIKYKGNIQIMLQTNGDLMNEKVLDELILKGVSRIDIASIDRYHKKKGDRIGFLKELFLSRGMTDDETKPLIEKKTYLHKDLSFGFWGANDDMWLGGNWARGRAMEKDIWLRDPSHNFCAILSGAIGFLGGSEKIPQEISIQLWKINPCCPGTYYPMGDARVEKISDVLEKMSKNKIYQALNKGEPWKMGEHLGITEEEAKNKTLELKNICLYCDHFFQHHVKPENEMFIALPLYQY
mgnify:CR=1 FL=1